MSGCGDPDCKCTYCTNDNYDRYIGDHMRECLDNINRFLHYPLKPDDFEDEEMYYTVVMYNVQKQLSSVKITN